MDDKAGSDVFSALALALPLLLDFVDGLEMVFGVGFGRHFFGPLSCDFFNRLEGRSETDVAKEACLAMMGRSRRILD